MYIEISSHNMVNSICVFLLKVEGLCCLFECFFFVLTVEVGKRLCHIGK